MMVSRRGNSTPIALFSERDCTMMPMHSPKRRIRPTFSVLAIGLLLALAHVAFGATLRVIEFYNAAQDHYFITASPAEIADLDTGVHPGWQRTGLSFDAYDANFASANPLPISGGTATSVRFCVPRSMWRYSALKVRFFDIAYSAPPPAVQPAERRD